MSTDRPSTARWWLLVAVLVVVVGVVGSVLAARSVAANDAERARRDFKETAANASSNLELTILRQEDLVASIKALLLGNLDLSNADFARWVANERAFERYHQIKGLGTIDYVTDADLPAYTAAAASDPTYGPLVVAPPGPRPEYCLFRRAVYGPSLPTPPRGLDVCTLGEKELLASRDSGNTSYWPFKVDKSTLPGLHHATTLLTISTPIYRSPTPPDTLAERRATFVGWVGIVASPVEVLAKALAGNPNLAATLRYRANGSDLAFHFGKAPSNAASAVHHFGNGWSTVVFGPAIAHGIFSDGTAVVVLVIGATLSLILGVLLVVLATGRARAQHLVHVKTDELNYQALHDPLTGLANRALINDRVERVLAVHRRQGTPCAALFLDLDGFKEVNDALGHDTGDQLLQAVAERLGETLRDVDTIGRLGGDEFVVLIDNPSGQTAPERVAERILDAIREPFELGDDPAVQVTTSIGIASGAPDTGRTLLREADTALYEAKAAGRNCVVVNRCHDISRPKLPIRNEARRSRATC